MTDITFTQPDDIEERLFSPEDFKRKVQWLIQEGRIQDFTQADYTKYAQAVAELHMDDALSQDWNNLIYELPTPFYIKEGVLYQASPELVDRYIEGLEEGEAQELDDSSPFNALLLFLIQA